MRDFELQHYRVSMVEVSDEGPDDFDQDNSKRALLLVKTRSNSKKVSQPHSPHHHLIRQLAPQSSSLRDN